MNEDVKIDRVTTTTGAGDSQSDKADSGKTDVVKENNTENVMETQEVETEVPNSEVVEGTNESEAKDEPKTNTESKKAVDPRTGEEEDDPELTKYMLFLFFTVFARGFQQTNLSNQCSFRTDSVEHCCSTVFIHIARWFTAFVPIVKTSRLWS